MAEERKLILKLGQKITDRIGVKVTVNDPEYWGLASVVTDEMAEVALSMKVRKPATAEQIAKKCGKSLERTEELLQEMSVIGLIEYNWENADHQYFYLKVEDSGIGIPEDSLEHIYERFYRVDKSHSREIGGTGLGLAITRNAVLMHRGAIKVFSTEGEGTIFNVRIPLNYIA